MFEAKKSKKKYGPSVIQVFDIKTKESRHYKFVNNPDNKLTTEDIKRGKTTLLGKGTGAKTKLAVPVAPVKNPSTDGEEFIELNTKPEDMRVVRISQRIWERNLPATFDAYKHYGTTIFFGQHEEKAYAVLPYCGQTLREILNNAWAPITPGEALTSLDLLNLKQHLQLGIAICKTVANFHKAGYLHRDLDKRTNITIVKSNHQIVAKLIDFEHARKIVPSENDVYIREVRELIIDIHRIYDRLPHKIFAYKGLIDAMFQPLYKLYRDNENLFASVALNQFIEAQERVLSEIEALISKEPTIDDNQGVIYAAINEPLAFLQKALPERLDDKHPVTSELSSESQLKVEQASEVSLTTLTCSSSPLLKAKKHPTSALFANPLDMEDVVSSSRTVSQ